MLPGNAERWNAVAGLDNVIGRFGRSLEAAVRLDDERHLAALHRRLYAFVRRLTRIYRSWSYTPLHPAGHRA